MNIDAQHANYIVECIYLHAYSQYLDAGLNVAKLRIFSKINFDREKIAFDLLRMEFLSSFFTLVNSFTEQVLGVQRFRRYIYGFIYTLL